MALTKSDKIKLAVAGCVVAVALIWRFAGSGDKSAAAGAAPKTVVQKVQDSIQGVKSTISAEVTGTKPAGKKVLYDNWGRDPFKDRHAVGAAAEEVEQNLVVKGIVRKDNQMFVMINDLIFTEGQEKEGIYVERIDNKSVFCKKGGKWFTLTWKEES